MEEGHYGNYTGNARHSRKEEIIHDRELIHDAKKQLHHADQDYKSDSPAQNSGLGPKKAGSALNMVFSTPVRGATGGGSDGKKEDMGNHPDDREIASGVTPTTSTTPTVPPATKTESFGVASGTSIGADRRERRLGKAERKASVSTGKTKARLERKADRIKRRQTIKGDGLQSKPTVKPSGSGGSKNSGGSVRSGGLGGSGGGGGVNKNTQNVNVYR
jgi:hypothetical protein